MASVAVPERLAPLDTLGTALDGLDALPLDTMQQQLHALDRADDLLRSRSLKELVSAIDVENDYLGLDPRISQSYSRILVATLCGLADVEKDPSLVIWTTCHMISRTVRQLPQTAMDALRAIEQHACMPLPGDVLFKDADTYCLEHGVQDRSNLTEGCMRTLKGWRENLTTDAWKLQRYENAVDKARIQALALKSDTRRLAVSSADRTCVWKDLLRKAGVIYRHKKTLKADRDAITAFIRPTEAYVKAVRQQRQAANMAARQAAAAREQVHIEEAVAAAVDEHEGIEEAVAAAVDEHVGIEGAVDEQTREEEAAAVGEQACLEEAEAVAATERCPACGHLAMATGVRSNPKDRRSTPMALDLVVQRVGDPFSLQNIDFGQVENRREVADERADGGGSMSHGPPGTRDVRALQQLFPRPGFEPTARHDGELGRAIASGLAMAMNQGHAAYLMREAGTRQSCVAPRKRASSAVPDEVNSRRTAPHRSALLSHPAAPGAAALQQPPLAGSAAPPQASMQAMPYGHSTLLSSAGGGLRLLPPGATLDPRPGPMPPGAAMRAAMPGRGHVSGSSSLAPPAGAPLGRRVAAVDQQQPAAAAPRPVLLLGGAVPRDVRALAQHFWSGQQLAVVLHYLECEDVDCMRVAAAVDAARMAIHASNILPQVVTITNAKARAFVIAANAATPAVAAHDPKHPS